MRCRTTDSRGGRDIGTAKIWVADTEPNGRFTLYTRGNTGEVFPNVITTLPGTQIVDAVHQGQTDYIVEIGALRPHELSGHRLATGVFGGYLYMSGSVMRLFGMRTPGIAVRDVDNQVLGEVPDLPPYRRAKGDRNLLASLALSRYVVRMLRSPDLDALDTARSQAQDWLASMPHLHTASDHVLLDWLATFPPRQAASMRRLLHYSGLASAPREGLLDRFLDRPGMPAGLANRIVGGTGEVDSAQLAQRMWALGRLVADDPTLTAIFDQGLTDIESRTRDTPLRPRSRHSSPTTDIEATTSTSWRRQHGRWTRPRSTPPSNAYARPHPSAILRSCRPALPPTHGQRSMRRWRGSPDTSAG